MKARAMKRAWEIRNKASQKFNCKISEIYFSECLRLAWAQIKKEEDMQKVKAIDVKTYQLIGASLEKVDDIMMDVDGLNLWQKGGHRRFYLGDGDRNDRSYYDAKTGVFHLQSRNFTHHIERTIGAFEIQY